MISYSKTLTKLEKIELFALSVHAGELRKHLRFVDYQQAEQAAIQLAQTFKSLFSTDELAEFRYLPIPRGGFVVMGMLAYALNLKPEQLLTHPTQTDKTVVIVDDCALSGLRFHGFLEKTTAPHIIFAHLFSAEALRQSILEQENRVTHCIAAHDLAERLLSPSTQMPLGSQHYWQGSTEMVAFAWSEPTLLTTQLTTNQIAENWHLISPQACLNNRMTLGISGNSANTSTIRVPESLLYRWQAEVLLLANSTSGEFYKLENLPAAMWRALTVFGHLDPALNWLQTNFSVSRESLELFLETAVSDGILARTS